MNSVTSRSDLKDFQRQMAEMVFRPLTPDWKMQKKTADGRATRQVAESFIKPNDRLSAFERLEIYNRCYWFRVLDSLYDDFPGLLAILGNRKFLKLANAYLARHPSASFTLRNLGSRLESFLAEEPQWLAPRKEMAMDMVRFEWAQILAFDGPARPPISADDILDLPPDKLHVSLQPYLSLLELEHAVDDFLIAIKKQEASSLRGDTSNTSNITPGETVPRKRIRLPKREKIRIAVHRHDNMLYYKRLEPAEFTLLQALNRGIPIEQACAAAISAHSGADIDWPAQIKSWFSNWSSLGWIVTPEASSSAP